jgi:clan AA aspartic protease
MIRGIVNDYYEPTIRFLLDIGNISHEIEAVVDTGFDGYATLPQDLIDAIGLPFLREEQIMLANGVIEIAQVYEGTIDWDGVQRLVEIQAADTNPLVGMALMIGYEIKIEARIGGLVQITQLP